MDNTNNPLGYIYSGYYISEFHIDKYGNKRLTKSEFIVDRQYVIDFKDTAESNRMEVWLPQPDYDKAKKILTDRNNPEHLYGLV